MADRIYKGPFNEDMRLVNMGDGTFATRTEAHPPNRLLSENGNSPYDRLKVTVGRSCFFAGRQRSTFYQYSIPTGETRVIKVVAGVDTLVQSFGATLNVAALRVELVSGGTEGGTFGTALPVLQTNTMTTVGEYTSQVTLAVGGTHSGGTIIDVLDLNAGTPARQAVAASATESEPIGFAPGTYYIRLVNTDGATATGIFKARWEERP
jgi:hypothetical protein